MDSLAREVVGSLVDAQKLYSRLDHTNSKRGSKYVVKHRDQGPVVHEERKGLGRAKIGYRSAANCWKGGDDRPSVARDLATDQHRNSCM